MLAAILHGKVSRQVEGLEDVVTSTVVGALDLQPPAHGILAWLGGATDPNGYAPPLESLDPDRVRVEFWPWWRAHDGGSALEPDVVLWLGPHDKPTAFVIIEAKWRSGKSGHGDRDQLAAQAVRARRRASALPGRPTFLGIVYVTAHLALPEQELVESQETFRQLTEGSSPPLRVYWTNWHAAHALLATAEQDPTSSRAARSVAAQAARALERWGLAPFDGFTPVPCVPTWSFNGQRATTR